MKKKTTKPEFEIEVCRSLIGSKYPAFRIEKVDHGSDCCKGMYDLIYQANGSNEEIAIMVDKKDIKDLQKALKKY